MKPSFRKIPENTQSSFKIWHQKQSYFGLDWHYHPELELHYLIQGKGIRFIGDNVSQFDEGELILLGQNLPHFWKSNEEYFQQKNLVCEAIVIHFLPDVFGRDFLLLPETFVINKLYERARKGLLISGEAKKKIILLMQKALTAQNLERCIVLLEIIDILASTSEFNHIASFNAFFQTQGSDTLRLNEIYSYTLNNFNNNISLDEIASIANLSVTSFCRYFKIITKKTYKDFLGEIRISHACRLIMEDKMNLEMICFQCGFNNVSNFYRQFKKIEGLTPLDYKRKFIARKNKSS